MADNTNQIIFPAEWGALRGRIAPSVQDSPSTYTIYARRKNGAYMDITGLTPTAKFTSTTAGGSVYTSTGTFTVTDGAAGEFTWLPSAADLGLDGSYYLQFEIDGERSEDRLRWVIQERLDSSGSVTPTAMAAITADELALVTALESALPAAEGDIFKYTGGAWATTAESSGAAWGDITGTLANQTDLQTALTDLNTNVNTAINDLETHIETTTNVHGIADTSVLITTTHSNLTTTAHGGLVPQDAAILSKSGAYPLAAGDEAKIIECNGTFTITLPNGLDTGFQAVIMNIGTGVITLAATTTLTTKNGAVTLAEQYGGATVYHAGSNVWRAIGDLS